MLPFDVTIPATVPQRSDIPEGLMNYPVYFFLFFLLLGTFGIDFLSAAIHVSKTTVSYMYNYANQYYNVLWQRAAHGISHFSGMLKSSQICSERYFAVRKQGMSCWICRGVKLVMKGGNQIALINRKNHYMRRN
jgi:hypothetical protein